MNENYAGEMETETDMNVWKGREKKEKSHKDDKS